MTRNWRALKIENKIGNPLCVNVTYGVLDMWGCVIDKANWNNKEVGGIPIWKHIMEHARKLSYIYFISLSFITFPCLTFIFFLHQTPPFPTVGLLLGFIYNAGFLALSCQFTTLPTRPVQV